MITAELLGITEDERKNLVLWVAFAKGGVDFSFGQTYKGRPAWRLIATYHNFLTKTLEQRLQWIRINIESQIDLLIREMVSIDTLVSEVKSQLSGFVGQTIQKDTAVFKIDRDNDGVPDAMITLKDDGTYTVA
jgi:hypothetical protein